MMPRTTWFSDWLKRTWPGAHGIVYHSKWFDLLPLLFSIGVLSAMGAFTVALVKGQRPFLFYVNDVGHLALLFLSLFLFLPWLDIGRPTVPRPPNNATDRAVRQFQTWLYALVVMWLLFYIARFFADLGSVTTSADALSKWANHASPYLNVVSAIPFIGLYVVLSRRSIDEPVWGIGHHIWVLLGVVSIVWAVQVWADAQSAIADANVATAIAKGLLVGPNDKVVADILNGLLVAPDILNGLRVAQDANVAAGIANGLLVGVAQALLIGKLDSGYIRLSTRAVSALYLYALIQPLFPYVFQNSQSPIRVGMQQAFVAVALIMKAVLILTLGRLIYTGRLHFYMSNVRWLDAHAAILIGRHDDARKVDGQSRARLPLFGFVHPERQGAIFRIETLDVRVDLALLNSWLGIGWDIRGLRAETVEFSDAIVKVKKFVLPGGTLRLGHDTRHASAEVFVEFAITREELREQLRGDQRIQEARKLNENSVVVTFVLKGLEADVAMIEQPGLDFRWMPVEAVDGGALVYACNVSCEQLG